jgi:hypothetical protein
MLKPNAIILITLTSFLIIFILVSSHISQPPELNPDATHLSDQLSTESAKLIHLNQIAQECVPKVFNSYIHTSLSQSEIHTVC